MAISPLTPEEHAVHAAWANAHRQVAAAKRLRARAIRLAEIALSLVAIGSLAVVVPLSTQAPHVGGAFVFGMVLLILVLLGRLAARGKRN